MADLKTIVQRMLDNGETEENIATVIKAQFAPKEKATTVSESETSDPRTAELKSLKEYARELFVPSKAQLAQVMEPLAHPQTVSDFGTLLLAGQGGMNPGGMNVRKALQIGRGALPSQETVGGALKTVGGAVKRNPNPLTAPIKTAGKLTEMAGERLLKPRPNAVAATRDASSIQTLAQHPGAYGEGGIMPSGMTPTELQGAGEPPASMEEQMLMNRTTPASRPRTPGEINDPRPLAQIIEDIKNQSELSPELKAANTKYNQVATDARHAELARTGNPPRGASMEEELANRAGTKPMGAARPISIKPETMTPLQWKENLAMYGADKLSQLTGLPRAEVIQRAGSSAGHLPLEAETQMMDMGGPR
jgi:hypothetical protein